MAGTLSATVVIGGQQMAAALAGAGTLTAPVGQNYALTAALTGAGTLDVASMRAQYQQAALLAGNGSLTPTLKQSYSAAADLAGAGTLSATATEVPWLPFTDTFTTFSGWTNRGAVGVISGISGGVGVSPANNFGFIEQAHNQSQDNVKIAITVGSNIGANDFLFIALRSDGTNVIYATLQQNAAPLVSHHTAAGGNFTNMFNGGQITRATGPATLSYTNGDVLSFEVVGNVYVIRKNGVIICRWNDSGGVINGAKVGASYRRWGLGVHTTGTAGRAMIDAVTISSMGATPVPPFQDLFNVNTTDLALGDTWTKWNGTVRATSGRAEVDAGFVWGSYTYSWPMQTSDVKVSFVYTTPTAGVILGLWARANTAAQILAQFVPPSASSSIGNSTNTLAAVTVNVRASAQVTWVNGDLCVLECIGNFYIMRQNGVAVVIWYDAAGSIYGATNDAAHRDVGIAMNNAATFGAGYNQFDAAAVAAGTFYPAKTVKNGSTQTWPTSATWVDLAAMVPVNDATYTSVLNGTTGVYATTAKALATLTASVPFTGSGATRQHTARIVRMADSAVIATGAVVTAASGTCTVTATNVAVAAGDSFKIQLNSDGTSAGTVTATTPSLTIT